MLSGVIYSYYIQLKALKLKMTEEECVAEEAALIEAELNPDVVEAEEQMVSPEEIEEAAESLLQAVDEPAERTASV